MALAQNLSHYFTEFFFFPFPGITKQRQILAFLFFSIYGLTLVLNLVISSAIWWQKNLHSPMYVLITLFLVVNIASTTTVMPKMTLSFLGVNQISRAGCLTQLFISQSTSMFKSVVLLLMAFDRYIAICRPLHYHTIVTKTSLLHLALAGLARNSVIATVFLYLASKLNYCKPNIILNFMCEYIVLVSLACGDVSRSQIIGLMSRTGVTLSDITILLVCYMKVLTAVLKIASGSARHKALHTCGNHVLVALLVYFCGLLSSFLHKVDESISYDFQNLTSIIYFLIPSMANPVIYGLCVREIKDCLMKPWKKK
ncbi:olfactory receptor 52P1-like [Hyperolius riggenbachi]|uniref:olfactory receptor 52P1-like n=1 Tax=Hyperolius riggenbachi TaxID=752182 RepID=UPI0035A38777